VTRLGTEVVTGDVSVWKYVSDGEPIVFVVSTTTGILACYHQKEEPRSDPYSSW
jgi:hypothetical protein